MLYSFGGSPDGANPDADSLAVVATQHGGFIPCVGGSYVLADGTRAIRALSWDEVEAVRQRFTALNRYNPSAISGTILKCEDENYALGPDGKPDYTQSRAALLLCGFGEALRAL